MLNQILEGLNCKKFWALMNYKIGCILELNTRVAETQNILRLTTKFVALLNQTLEGWPAERLLAPPGPFTSFTYLI